MSQSSRLAEPRQQPGEGMGFQVGQVVQVSQALLDAAGEGLQLSHGPIVPRARMSVSMSRLYRGRNVARWPLPNA